MTPHRIIDDPDASETFGSRLRKARAGRSLRSFARLMGVRASYLSQVERDAVPPPTEERIARIVELLGGDASFDQWMAWAGRVPRDLWEVYFAEPAAVADLLRAVRGLSAAQLAQLRDRANAMHAEIEPEYDDGDDERPNVLTLPDEPDFDQWRR